MAERNRRASHRALTSLAVAGVVLLSAVVASAGIGAGQPSIPRPFGWLRAQAGDTGLAVRYPSNWHRQPFDLPVAGAEFSGVIVSNSAATFGLRNTDGTPTTTWNMSRLPRAGVAIELELLSSSPINPQSVPDVSMPPDPQYAVRVPAARPGLPAEWLYRTYEGGQLVAVHEWFGASVPAPDRLRATEIIASIDRVAGTPWTGTRTASGWRMSYPGNWDAQLQPNPCPGKTKGPSAIIVTNSNFVFRRTFSACRMGPAHRWVLAGFPRDGVALALEPPLPLGLTPTHLTMPPSLSGLHPTGGIVGGPKELFGVFPAKANRDQPRFEVRVWIGPEAPPEPVTQLSGILKTIYPPDPPILKVPIPTCAPNGGPWSSAACPESGWVRSLVANVGGTITGIAQGIEPQRGDAFAVSLDGYRLNIGAISSADTKKLAGWFSMGEFAAGMADAGRVHGVYLAGIRRTGHWEWSVPGFTVQVYAANPNVPTAKKPPRSVIAQLVAASLAPS